MRQGKVSVGEQPIWRATNPCYNDNMSNGRSKIDTSKYMGHVSSTARHRDSTSEMICNGGFMHAIKSQKIDRLAVLFTSIDICVLSNNPLTRRENTGLAARYVHQRIPGALPWHEVLSRLLPILVLEGKRATS